MQIGLIKFTQAVDMCGFVHHSVGFDDEGRLLAVYERLKGVLKNRHKEIYRGLMEVDGGCGGAVSVLGVELSAVSYLLFEKAEAIQTELMEKFPTMFGK